jgi:dephospho-CoA kinase
MPPSRIIGIGGTDASGKDTVGEALAESYGWQFISVTDILREEAKKRGWTLTRSNLRKISAQWRHEHGMAVLVEIAVQRYYPQKYKGLAISSLRHPAEADKIHELGGQVVWVDADPRIRYERILKRNRGTEDSITFEKFLAEEQAQMHSSGDEAALNLAGVKAKADIYLPNDGHDREVFIAAVEKTLAPYLG